MATAAQTSGKRPHDHWIVAAIIGLPCAYLLTSCCAVYLKLPLARDAMIFQYTAWAVRHEEVLYRDILDVNGPLITLIHLAFQALGGESARGLRLLDLSASAGVFAALGASLANLTPQQSMAHTRIGAGVGERSAWALTTVIVLLAAYFSFNFWDTAQREGLYFLWVLLSVALQSEALARHSTIALCIAGAFSGATWLGKPTFVLFTLTQAFVVAVDHASHPRRRSLTWFGLGAVGGASTIAAISTSFADMPRWVHLLATDVPDVYRYIHATTFGDLWIQPRAIGALLGLGQAIVIVVKVVRAQWPTRSLLFALLPLPAIGNVLIQSKGYFYHYEPLWIGVALQWLVLIRAASSRAALLGLSVLVSSAVGFHLFATSYARLDALITSAHPAAHDERLRLKLFSQRDSMLLDEQIAADYLAHETTPTARVQVFGMDPSVLYLAHRRSATPYIYSFDLVLDEALSGARLANASEAQLQVIEAHGRQRRDDFATRLRQRPPDKFVFPARADFLPEPPEAAFRSQLPDAAAWFDRHYRLEATVGTLRIYGLTSDAAR